MWYDRSNASMMVFFGAALAFIGIGVRMMDFLWPGVILMIIGVSLVVIGFTILKFYVRLGLKKR